MPSSIKPKKLGHLVLKVRDIHESVRFYTEVLGLEVSDWIEEQMVFLRCGSDHHDLGLFQLPDNSPDLNNISSEGSPGLEHFSYEVEDYREVERAVSILQEKNIEIVRGPGKHGPGKMFFWCLGILMEILSRSIVKWCKLPKISHMNLQFGRIILMPLINGISRNLSWIHQPFIRKN